MSQGQEVNSVIAQVKRLILAGLGIEAQGSVKFEDWVRQGEENNSECAKLVKRFMNETEKNATKIDNQFRQLTDHLLRRSPIATRSDIERLEKKVQDLSSRLDRANKKGT